MVARMAKPRADDGGWRRRSRAVASGHDAMAKNIILILHPAWGATLSETASANAAAPRFNAACAVPASGCARRYKIRGARRAISAIPACTSCRCPMSRSTCSARIDFYDGAGWLGTGERFRVGLPQC